MRAYPFDFRRRRRSGGGLVTGLGIGLGVGVACAAMFDPARGAARRALVGDKLRSLLRSAVVAGERHARDLANRARGTALEAKARLTEGEVSDDILAERVRAQIGRPVSHPRALEVGVHAGRVSLSGPVPADEVDGLLRTVAKVRGVRGVEHHLDVRGQPGDAPDLPGPGSRQAH